MPDVTMPQLGETVTEGTITRWHKQVGDRVEEDEILYEVSTDKVDSEVPAPSGGWLAEILVQEGDTVDVGAKLAVISDQEPAGGSQPAGGGGGEAQAAPAEAPREPEPQEQEEAAPARAEAAGSANGSAAEPAVAEAPPETPGGPSPERGVEDEEEAEEVSARAGDSTDGAGSATNGGRGGRGGAAPTAPAGGGTRPAGARPAGRDDASAKILSPVVRRLIAENDLDPSRIAGTGAGGRITRADVLAVIERGDDGARKAAPAPPAAAPATATAPPPPEAKAGAPVQEKGAPAPARTAPAPAARPGDRDEVVPFSNIRRRTSEHMVRSLATSAHTLVATEVDYENVERVRRTVKDRFKAEEGFSLSYLPFIARALVDALEEYPNLNASVGDDSLIVHRYVNLGIAVDLSFEGLIVPVVRDAETKRLRALAREMADLANRARSKKLGADEVSGGTFTITNAGGYGTVLTVPIINQPQVAILSTDGVKPKPVAVALPGGDYGVAVHSVGNLALSFDHRANDGAYAAACLGRLRDILETRDWSQEL